jgi:hypothetical protein
MAKAGQGAAVTLRGELRRQATAAGVFLDMSPTWLSPGFTTKPLTDDEAEQLLVWLDAWQSEPRERHEMASFGLLFDGDGQEHYTIESVNGGVLLLDGAGDATIASAGDFIADGFKAGQTVTTGQLREWSWVPGEGRVLPAVTPLLDPPAGFGLIRKSWCPRCDRIGGDPLGWWHDFGGKPGDRMKGYLRRPRCAVFPPAPDVEIGPGCRGMFVVWPPSRSPTDRLRCGARRLYRWGLRRAPAPRARTWTDITITIDGEDVGKVADFTWSDRRSFP